MAYSNTRPIENPSVQDLNALLALFTEARYEETTALAEAMTRRFPRHPYGWKVLGAALRQLGRNSDALAPMQQAVGLVPEDAEAHNNLGATLRDLGRLSEAVASSRRALKIRPDFAEAHSNLGDALKDLGRLEDAVESYRRALEVKPDYATAHSNLGYALTELGRLDDAVVSCRRALEINPDYAAAHTNLGVALYDLGRLEDAVACYRRALEINPDMVEAHGNLGAALLDLGRLDDAAASNRRALEVKPDYAMAHMNLGNCLKELGRFDDAAARYRRALELKPDFIQAHSNLVLSLLYHSGNEAEVIDAELRRWNERHAVPLTSLILSPTNDPSPERRLRIGYLSSDFKLHSVAFFLLPLLEAHDHRQVHVTCYSANACSDDVTIRFRACTDEWCDLVGRSDDDIARQIREDRIDLLVDLSGHTAGNSLPVFARKPAPIQVSYLGFPVATGLDTIDHRFTDHWADPLGATDVTEQLVRLPETAWCFSPLSGSPPVGELPAAHCRHVTFGCFNNFAKVTEEMLRLWVRILQRVPGSRLALKNSVVRQASVAQRVLTFFSQQGIGTDRLELLPRTLSPLEHLHCYHGVDLALDTFPYHGTTTTCEALWMGVPVITLAGSRHVARVGVSLLSNVGLPELVAYSVEDYVEKAAALACDLRRLGALRAGLRERMQRSPLMDGAKFARGVEAAYRAMWRGWCARQNAARGTLLPSA
jgi:protein O-GlcNAc transferase